MDFGICLEQKLLIHHLSQSLEVGAELENVHVYEVITSIHECNMVLNI
jgi:hypothetical protein